MEMLTFYVNNVFRSCKGFLFSLLSYKAVGQVYVLLVTVVATFDWVTPDVFGLVPLPLQSSLRGVCTNGGNCIEAPTVYLDFVVSAFLETGIVICFSTLCGTCDKEVFLESFTDSEETIASL